MSFSLKPSDLVDVVLLSSGPLSALASRQMARQFDLPLASAEALLSQGSGTVATQYPQNSAKAAIRLLATLGVRVATVPVGGKALPELFDLCLHLTDLRAAGFVEQNLRDLGLWGAPDRPDFSGPGGLQICNVSEDLARRALLTLSAAAGVDVISCPQNDALYDLFVTSSQKRSDLRPQLRHLAEMGCHAAHPWPAIAVDLDRQMLAHFETRFANHGLVCVNQAFQRYDLVLTGIGDVSIRDFVDFLTVRGHTPSVAFDAVMNDKGLKIEYALSRKAAERFVADYTMIGLQVRAEFVDRQEKVIKMMQVKPGFTKVF